MTTRTLVQALGTLIVTAALAWQCAAGRVPAGFGQASMSDSLVPDAHNRPETAVVGARF